MIFAPDLCNLSKHEFVVSSFDLITDKVGGAVAKHLCAHFERRLRPLPPGKYVSLCFDDFPKSAAETAAPMIEARGWRASWYVSGGFMGQTDPNYGKMFDASDLQSLRERGHDFGCHTFDHTNCRHAAKQEITQQLQKNQTFLDQHQIGDARSFAFPFGAASLAAKRQIAANGRSLRSIQTGTNRTQVDLNFLKACGLQEDKGRTARAVQELQALQQTDGWLILFTHDVCESPSSWGVTAQEYAELLDAVAASGAEVLTVGDMVEYVEASASVVQHAA